MRMSDYIYHFPCLVYTTSALLVYFQGKGTAVLVRVMVAFNRSRCLASLTLNLNTRQECRIHAPVTPPLRNIPDTY
jgi:hypothetical protein